MSLQLGRRRREGCDLFFFFFFFFAGKRDFLCYVTMSRLQLAADPRSLTARFHLLLPRGKFPRP